MSASNAESARPLLLIVDDDAAICSAYEQIFGAHGYDVLTAGSRSTALATLEKVNGAINVMVLDIGLPDADGAELAREIHGLIGARPTLYVSGWADEFWNLSDAPTPWLVMQKPIPIAKLVAAVDYLAGRRKTLPDDL
ncbi:MAG TPA: response regulator [Gemmatimonadaceae bacterium]